MKHIFIIFPLFFLLCTSGCSSSQNDNVSVSWQIADSTGIQVDAIGVELDPHFLSQNVTRGEGIKQEDWKIIEKRVTEMNIRRFRVMVLPEWFEPINDNNRPDVTDWNNLTFYSPEMQSLYAVLDLAEQNDIDVTLVLWGCATNARILTPEYADIKQHFLSGKNFGNWVVAPDDIDEWCENFSILIRHLIETQKYTCIKEITPINEPDWSFFAKGTQAPASEYIKMCKALHDRFKKDNIRHLVRFNLSDNTDNAVTYLKSCTDELAEVADIFNSHTYIFGYETPNSAIQNWEQENCRLAASAGKHHFVGEFGSNQTVGSARQKDIDCFERGVLITRIALNLINAGACGVSYWSLIDQYYNRDAGYGEMQQLGMWRSLKHIYDSDTTYQHIKITSDYQVRPQYHAYSLLTQFIAPGSDVYPIETGEEYIAASAFKNKAGKWVCAFANAKNEAQTVILSANKKSFNGIYNYYKYIESCLPQADEMIESSESVTAKNNKMKISLPENSVIFLVQQ